MGKNKKEKKLSESSTEPKTTPKKADFKKGSIKKELQSKDLFSQVFQNETESDNEKVLESISPVKIRPSASDINIVKKSAKNQKTVAVAEPKIKNVKSFDKTPAFGTKRKSVQVQVDSDSSDNEINEVEFDEDDDNMEDDDLVTNEQFGIGDSDNESDSRQNDDEEDEDAGSQSDADTSSDEEQEERTYLRKQLKNLSFEELEALKHKMGLKEYNEAMFGSKREKKPQKNEIKKFKRFNNDEPEEVSSKRRVPKLRQIVEVREKTRKDPRFDNKCGEYSDTFWNSEYSFLRDMQKNEATEMKKNLKHEGRFKQREMRRFIQRVNDKEKSIAAKEREAQKTMQDRAENRKRIEEGKRPFYVKKSTKKLMELVEKYDELKASGGLEKYMKKKRKRNAVRDRKALQQPLK